MWMTTYFGGEPSDIESDLSIRAKAQLQAYRNAPFAINQATLRYNKTNPSLPDTQKFQVMSWPTLGTQQVLKGTL
jgi:hypothetical protein